MGFAIPVVAAAFAPAISTTLATGVFGLAASTILTDVLAGALIGAVGSMATGGDPLTGALFGGIGAGIGGALGGLGGGGEAAAAGAAEAAPAGLSSGLSGADPFNLGMDQALGGGMDVATGAKSAIESSLTQSQAAIGGIGERVNPFASGAQGGLDPGLGGAGDALSAGMPDMINTDTFGLETAGAGAEQGFFDKLTSNEGLLGGVDQAGKYLMNQSMLEDQAEAKGDQERKTQAEKAKLQTQGIVREGNPILSSLQIQSAISARPNLAGILPHYVRPSPYGNTGTSQPLYKTAGYHAEGSPA